MLGSVRRAVVFAAALAAAGVLGEENPFVTTAGTTILLSANDGDVMRLIDPELDIEIRDSITVIRLGPDHPPRIKTVYGTVPNTISGPPHMAISGGGRYAFVTNHSIGLDVSEVIRASGPAVKPAEPADANIVSVIDLDSEDLRVAARIALPPYPKMADANPDGRRVLLGGGKYFHVVTVGPQEGSFDVRTVEVPLFVSGFDISPCGTKILATGTATPREEGNPFVDWDISPHLFAWSGEEIRYLGPVESGEFEEPFDGSFSPRFSPKGNRAYVLNGLGIAGRGGLDSLVAIDMTSSPPSVCGVVPQLGDGLESLAVDPAGKMAVVCCLERSRKAMSSHLAVVDLERLELLYHTPIEPVPEGIEFTRDGKQLFVGCTGAYRIVVFDVMDRCMLVRSPYVLHTGHCHASLAIFER